MTEYCYKLFKFIGNDKYRKIKSLLHIHGEKAIFGLFSDFKSLLTHANSVLHDNKQLAHDNLVLEIYTIYRSRIKHMANSNHYRCNEI